MGGSVSALPLICLHMQHTQLAFANLLNLCALDMLAIGRLLRVKGVLPKSNLKYQVECWDYSNQRIPDHSQRHYPIGCKSKRGKEEECRQVEWQSFIPWSNFAIIFKHLFFPKSKIKAIKKASPSFSLWDSLSMESMGHSNSFKWSYTRTFSRCSHGASEEKHNPPLNRQWEHELFDSYSDIPDGGGSTLNASINEQINVFLKWHWETNLEWLPLFFIEKTVM